MRVRWPNRRVLNRYCNNNALLLCVVLTVVLLYWYIQPNRVDDSVHQSNESVYHPRPPNLIKEESENDIPIINDRDNGGGVDEDDEQMPHPIDDKVPKSKGDSGPPPVEVDKVPVQIDQPAAHPNYADLAIKQVVVKGITYPADYHSSLLAETFENDENVFSSSIRNATKYAWDAYKMHAWGYDELKPMSKSQATWFNLGLTIIDSLDTLILMNFTTDVDEARMFVATRLTIADNNKYVNLFETTIRILGGLLSAFHLTNDAIYLQKAEALGRRLMPAFKSPSGIPYSDVNLQSRMAKAPNWASESSTSEVSTIQLEFSELARLTKDASFAAAVDNVSKLLQQMDKPVEHLVPIMINPNTGKLRFSATISFGARGDSYYEYLLKQYIQCDRCNDKQYLMNEFAAAMQSVIDNLMKKTKRQNHVYIGELLASKNFSPKMDHLVCFLPGTILLAIKNGLDREKFMPLAEGLMDTCIAMYDKMDTGLAPEIVHFHEDGDEDMWVKPQDSHSLLRPETVESLFYFWRYTHNEKYRKAAWRFFLSFERYAKQLNGDGYCSLDSVLDRLQIRHTRNKMESFFLAETLKYLYLIFKEDDVLPLSKYVFNTEAHPLPIWR